MRREGRKTVLHVEDDPSLQRLVRVAFDSLAGITVQTAGDGFEAVELAMAAAPDLVLLDEGLPGMSGSETYAALRKAPGMRDVSVLFLTATTDPQAHARLMALGAQDILVKPCRPRLLINAVQLALAGP